MPDEDPNAKRWVEVWKQTGQRLEQLERQRLRSFRYEDHVAEIDELLELAFRFAKLRKQETK